jgi:hypothetical protein
LAHNIQVIVYSGQYDNVCNTASAQRWIDTIDWTNI